ncbi:MAG: SAM-dependent methyltransferase [Aeromicrobium sp.]
MAAHLVSWQAAWDAALYADGGFFRTVRPADHFRTSAHLWTFARAVAELARRTDAATVVDLGAGGGELLAALRPLLPDVGLVGVEVASRPDGLPDDVAWTSGLPDRVDGLLIANEWLDNIPCPVVERDAEGSDRVVLVDPSTGEEALGEVHDSAWMRRWWTLTAPGERAEDGSARDAAWADAVARVDGVAVAIDYGHVLPDRPPFGTLRSYAGGREVEVRPDGSRDVTAHVAVDAVAAAVDGRLVRQRDALAELGVDGRRPPLDQARTDPAGYVRALSGAGEAAELTSRGGLGDFWWIVTDRRGAA